MVIQRQTHALALALPLPLAAAHHADGHGQGGGTHPGPSTATSSTSAESASPRVCQVQQCQSSSEDSCGSWQPHGPCSASASASALLLPAAAAAAPASSSRALSHQRSTINRQTALNALAAVHRRFNLPGSVPAGGRPQAEFRASANKSLDILRQNIQAAVTEEIDSVIKKYLEKFFVPAVNNIRTNLGEESVGEDQVRAVCRAMLDGARCLYAAPPRPSASARTAAPSPSELSDSESSNGADSRFGRPGSSPLYGKRKESDTDSDFGVTLRRKKKNESFPNAEKWDPARLNRDTLFIMGSVANKVLGLGQSRGRLYSKHSGLLRYPADSADKEWIANRNMTAPSGGRTYIMVLEDIEELVFSEGYRHSPSLRLDELSGFRAPPFMLKKIQAFVSKRGAERHEDCGSSTPTPTPPPSDLKTEIKIENADDASQPTDDFKFDGADVKNEYPIKTEDIEKSIKMELLDDNSLPDEDRLRDDRFGSLPNDPLNLRDRLDAASEANYWKCLDINSAKADLSAAEFLDADIFLNSDFCNYVNDSVVRPKHSSPMSRDLFDVPDKPHALDVESKPYVPAADQEMNVERLSGNPIPKTSGLSTNAQNVFTVSNAQLKTITIRANLPSTHLIHQNKGNTSNATSSSQPSVTLQPNLILPSGRTIHSIQTSPKLLNTPGQAIIGFGTRPNIINSSNFINLPAKSLSSGNILHNAIVSRNMVNRSFQLNRFDVAKTVIGSTITTIVPATLVTSPQTSHTRMTSGATKIEEDTSISTTKAMIDNTCNSSAMLKKVLTLGSANVNKTFLPPPIQKNPTKGPSSSNLSASHATLTALLSGNPDQSVERKDGN